ncbi:Ras-related protein RABH1b [Zea mays]|uniref:Ras-related protein RABH1b n=1 Tax=Zea mays TaxID=4577 RepID=A0A1D6J0I1_MAIZE|nr:Ras-related protein RABH1b [Zea mays]AQK41584.1 Ras-related protein RABH1b [Zea mays]AQK41596.1 Ras-related protein RABH1b [Zea mays]AQK41597.1 Ras-related protein RABH1b [Zea mays]AQK41600.1 Ras-related protein RABH1b [Zea mays]
MEGDPACGLALADEEAECSSWDSDDEYQKFIQNMNPPRVTIDNTSCPSAIVIHFLFEHHQQVWHTVGGSAGPH